MSIKQINEGFKSRFSNVISESLDSSFADDLRTALEDAAFRLSMQQVANLKAYEVAFQETLERMYPDKLWWEITDCNIFWDLFENRDIDHTISEIINQLKVTDTVDEAMMMPSGSDKEQPIATNDKGDRLVYKNGLGYSVFSKNDVSLGGFDEIKGNDGKVDHEAAKKKFLSGNFNESKSSVKERAALKEDLEEAVSNPDKLDEIANFLDNFFYKQKMDDIVVDVDGHQIVASDDENVWRDASIFEFIFDDCLVFDSEGNLADGLAAAEPFIDKLIEYGKLFGVSHINKMNEAVSNPERTISKVDKNLSKAVDKDLVRDLTLCIENDRDVYRRSITPIINNLKRKMAKGQFDEKLAIQAFYYAVEAALKMPHFYRYYTYSIDTVSVPERYAVAKELLEYYMGEIELENPSED